MPVEASAMAEWVPLLPPECLKPAVALATAKPAGLTAHSRLASTIRTELIAANPARSRGSTITNS
jgi:hypothetical protein